MEDTHTIQDIDALILEKTILLKTANDNDKKKLRGQINKLIKHFNDCNEKQINGKVYPDRMKGFPDDKPMNKKALLELIDSVPDGLEKIDVVYECSYEGPNFEGVSVGKNTFEFVDKGWSTPKTMNPKGMFS